MHWGDLALILSHMALLPHCSNEELTTLDHQALPIALWSSGVSSSGENRPSVSRYMHHLPSWGLVASGELPHHCVECGNADLCSFQLVGSDVLEGFGCFCIPLDLEAMCSQSPQSLLSHH